MTRRFAFTILAIFTLTLVARGAAIAHPGHEQKVLGTVTMAAADHVMLKDPQGKEVKVLVGMRVVVTAVTDEDDDKLIAQIIELGNTPGHQVASQRRRLS